MTKKPGLRSEGFASEVAKAMVKKRCRDGGFITESNFPDKSLNGKPVRTRLKMWSTSLVGTDRVLASKRRV